MVVRCSALMATKLKHITKAPILARYNAPKMRRNIPYIMRNECSRYDGSIIRPGIRYIEDAEMITSRSQIAARIRRKNSNTIGEVTWKR